MAFLILFKFAVKCYDVLAWPLIAIVYPLCASIRAIENESSSGCRNLVAYWLLFALSLIFEHAFFKLLHWVPFWSYIKLLTWCWLVIPNFNGAFHVYKHFLHPCLFTDPKVLVDMFKKRKEFFIKCNDFVTTEDRLVKENDPEEFKELVLIASKSHCRELTNDVEAVVATENKVADQNLVQIENTKSASDEINEISGKTSTEGREIAEVPDESKKVEQKWTCVLCHVTTKSRTTLDSHLVGKRHKVQIYRFLKENPKGSEKSENMLHCTL